MRILSTIPQLFFLVLTSFALLFSFGIAQQPDTTPPSAPYQLNLSSRLVMLDVVVTDKAGNIRSDLKQSDFHISEDGIPQTISVFEPPSAHQIPAGEAIHSTADLERVAPQAPVDVVVLDELNTTFQDMALARYALKKYLNAQSSQSNNHTPTLLMAVNFDKVTILQDYTQDNQSILSALDHHLSAYPWNLQRGEDRLRTLALSLGVLEQVAQATVGHPGHKNLIWVGKGFPGINLASPSLSRNEVSGIEGAMHQAVNMLRDARITLYTVDPTILSSEMAVKTDADSVIEADGVPGAPAPDPFGGDASFTHLAMTTGGKAFYSRNDVDKEVGESARDGVSYYTIAYRPTSTSDEARLYRKIRIGFTIAGLHAAYREGYYSKTDPVPSHAGTRMTYDMDAAEESTMVYTGLTVSAILKPGTTDTYLVGVPQRELRWSAEGEQESSRLILVIAALDAKNRTLARNTQEATAHRALDLAATSPGLAKFEIRLPRPTGASRLRFVLRSVANGLMGTADIAIPGASAPRPSR